MTSLELIEAQRLFSEKARQLNLPILVEYPIPHVIKVTLNKPKALNTIPAADHFKYDELWTLYEQLNPFRVLILTGSGRTFCAGADLKDWKSIVSKERSGDNSNATTGSGTKSVIKTNGFLGISNRSNIKPIICSLNGSSYGGGTETLLNCELVLAPAGAKIALPEPRQSVAAIAGALPRLGRLVPLQSAMKLALLAEPIPVEQLHAWGIVNEVLPSVEKVQQRAIEYAEKILLSAPEALRVTMAGIRNGYESGYNGQNGIKTMTNDLVLGSETRQMESSENIVEGLNAFVNKRKPKWKL